MAVPPRGTHNPEALSEGFQGNVSEAIRNLNILPFARFRIAIQLQAYSSYRLRRFRGETSEHQAHGGDTDAGFAAGDRAFLVFAQPPVEAQPSNSAFDDPPFLAEDKALGSRWPPFDFQAQLPPLQRRHELFV